MSPLSWFRSRRASRQRADRINRVAPAITQLEDRILLSAVAASSVDDLVAADTFDATTAETTNAVASLSSLSTGSFSNIAIEGDAVLAWNDLFGELLTEADEQETPGHASRAMAILNLAIYDAVQIASGNADGTFYDYGQTSRYEGVSADVAASQAAATVLTSLFPQHAAMIASFNEAVISGHSDRSNSAALGLGERIGETIIEIRSTDGSDVLGEYEYVEGAGNFQPDPENPDVPAWGPAWADVDTFAIGQTNAFTPASPPALDSVEYAASYNEVLELGSADSETRTAEETEVGIFWAYDRSGLGTPLALYNDILITVAEQEGNTLDENAALFAQASVAMADAAIVAWDSKFSENLWRPGTAITEGDTDGNPLTEGDPNWVALGAPDGDDDTGGLTPQFPTYISGHATFGGALFETLREFYGTDDISFEVHSEELQQIIDNPELAAAYGLESTDATRTFSSFSEAEAENGRSRVYLGIHFDFDDIVGQEVGQEIAAAVAATGGFDVATVDDQKDKRDRTDHRTRTTDRRSERNDRRRAATETRSSSRREESRQSKRTTERDDAEHRRQTHSLDQFFASTDIAEQLDRLQRRRR